MWISGEKLWINYSFWGELAFLFKGQTGLAAHIWWVGKALPQIFFWAVGMGNLSFFLELTPRLKVGIEPARESLLCVLP